MFLGPHRTQLNSQNSRQPDLIHRYICLSLHQYVPMLPIDCVILDCASVNSVILIKRKFQPISVPLIL